MVITGDESAFPMVNIPKVREPELDRDILSLAHSQDDLEDCPLKDTVKRCSHHRL